MGTPFFFARRSIGPLNSFRSDDLLAKVNFGHEEVQLGYSGQRGRNVTLSAHEIRHKGQTAFVTW